jgi:MFS family permease
VQSLTADYHAADSRGKAFGALWLTISFGGMLGALYATNVGSLQPGPFGIDGWRFVFYSVAATSILVGVLNALYVHDPSYHQHQQTQNEQHQSHASPQQQQRQNFIQPAGPTLNAALLKSTFLDICSVMRIPTFAIIIIQGIIGSVPYASLVFLTLYLQLLGMSDAAASGLVATYLLCGGFGGLLGGWIGDTVARRYPNHGRVAATQVSVASGIPFAFLIFKGLPLDGEPTTVGLYALAIAAFSLATSWPAPCANNPIFAEIVPVRLRNLVYAFDRCFEGAVAAFATPFVGRLSERYFGFNGTSTITGNPEIDVHNAQAMGNALLVFTVVPWAFCFVAYGGLHLTYPVDRRRAVMYDREKYMSGGSLASLDYEVCVDGAVGGSGGGLSSSDHTPRGLGSSSLSLRQAGLSSSFEERMPLQGGNTSSSGMNSA